MQGTRGDNLLRELRAHMPQLEKACVQQQRPTLAENKLISYI